MTHAQPRSAYRARGPETPPGPPGALVLPPGTGSPRPGPRNRHAIPLLLPEEAADMPGQQTCAPPVIVTFPASSTPRPPNRPPARSPRRSPPA